MKWRKSSPTLSALLLACLPSLVGCDIVVALLVDHNIRVYEGQEYPLPNGYCIFHHKKGTWLLEPSMDGKPAHGHGKEAGGSILFDPVLSYAVVGNIVVGEVGKHRFEQYSKQGFFVLDTSTKEIKHSLDKDAYQDALKHKGIEKEPALRRIW